MTTTTDAAAEVLADLDRDLAKIGPKLEELASQARAAVAEEESAAGQADLDGARAARARWTKLEAKRVDLLLDRELITKAVAGARAKVAAAARRASYREAVAYSRTLSLIGPQVDEAAEQLADAVRRFSGQLDGMHAALGKLAIDPVSASRLGADRHGALQGARAYLEALVLGVDARPDGERRVAGLRDALLEIGRREFPEEAAPLLEDEGEGG